MDDRLTAPSYRTRAVFSLLSSVILLSIILIVALIPLDGRPLGEWPLSAAASSEDGCSMGLTTTLAYSLCEPVHVTTAFTPTCVACPNGINVVFVQVDVGMYLGHWPTSQERPSLEVLEVLKGYESEGHAVSVSVVHYDNDGVQVALKPTLDLDAARGPLRSFGREYQRFPLFMEAAKRTVAMIEKGRALHGGHIGPECEFVILFSYVKELQTDKGRELVQAGRHILRTVDNLYVGCPTTKQDCCEVWEPQVPKSRRYYAANPAQGGLRSMMEDGLRDISGPRIESLTVDQWIPNSLSIVDGSWDRTPVETAIEGNRTRLRWDWPSLEMSKRVSVTFRANPQELGEFRSEAAGRWRDSQRRSGEERLESEPITVLDVDCFTPTPPPLPSHTPTPTATSTLVATATPTATATSRPRPVYLPVTLNEICLPGEVHTDVVLVIDVSTSMNHRTPTGPSKLAATQDAAKQFVSLMDLAEDPLGLHDQVAVVGFNEHAWIEAELGRGAARVNAAIDALADRMAEGTRLDLAFEAGAKAILDGPRRPDDTPVLVLLTDGLPNMVPYAEDGTMETTVLREARTAKDAGIEVFTIATGAPDDTNPELLADCASAPDHYFYAPDAADLSAIYRSIAYAIDCPRSRFWGQR